MALVIAPSISYTAEMLSADVIGLRQRASNWCLVGLIAGGILLSPIFGFLMALVVDILIGLLNDGGVTVAAPSGVAPQPGREPVRPEPGSVAAP